MSTEPIADDRPPAKPGERAQETTPAEERGERLDTAKAIARGGKTTGHVPGAEPSKGAADRG